MIAGQRLDLAAIEKSGQTRLPSTAPGLDHAAGRNCREDATLQGSCMERPHSSIVRLGRDERTSVVDQPERRARLRHQRRPTPARSSTRSAFASSSALNIPCSRSHARTERRPRRAANHRSAASARAEETVRPSSAACSSISLKSSAGNEIERFTTDDILRWYDHGTTTATGNVCLPHRSRVVAGHADVHRSPDANSGSNRSTQRRAQHGRSSRLNRIRAGLRMSCRSAPADQQGSRRHRHSFGRSRTPR